jgi:hypothetical protein
MDCEVIMEKAKTFHVKAPRRRGAKKTKELFFAIFASWRLGVKLCIFHSPRKWVRGEKVRGSVFLAAQLCQGQTVPRDELQLRIAFANKHFATRSAPGLQTDRGKAHIVPGPPDQISG